MKFSRFRHGESVSPPFAALGLISIVLTGSAMAQSEPTPSPPSPTVPRPPQTPGPTPPPTPTPSPGPNTPGSPAIPRGETLSEHLDRTDGVIRPPPVGDPDIVQQPPDTNATIKVIPPPGEPGGDPNVQPK